MSDRAIRAQEREERRNRRLSYLSTAGTPMFHRQNPPPPPPPRTPANLGPRFSPASSVSNPPTLGSFSTPATGTGANAPTSAPGLEPSSLAHVIGNIFNHPEDGILAQALAHTGVLSFVDLIALKERDIDDMTYPVASLPDGEGNSQPDELRPLPFNMKAILRGFVGFIPYRAKTLQRPITVYNCMDELDSFEFHTFRTSPDFAYFNNSTNGQPIVPSPVQSAKSPRTPAEEFSRSFKLDPSYFPTLSEDKGYDQFERELTAIVQAWQIHVTQRVPDPMSHFAKPQISQTKHLVITTHYRHLRLSLMSTTLCHMVVIRPAVQ